jgi:hypothetical protein
VSHSAFATPVAPDFQAILLILNPFFNSLKKIWQKKFLARIFFSKKEFQIYKGKIVSGRSPKIILGRRELAFKILPKRLSSVTSFDSEVVRRCGPRAQSVLSHQKMTASRLAPRVGKSSTI